MRLRDIIREKGSEVYSVEKSDTVRKAVEVMVDKNVGAVLVMDSGKPVGIFTERDLLKRCCFKKLSLDDIIVEEVMTKNLIFGSLDDSVQEAGKLMTEKRIRHLPILENGEVKGIISIGDLMKAQCRIMERENESLKNYIEDKYIS
ncbi:MAG: hypothetical protein PWQ20_875 [Thermotogaceae bacterium]|jgi:CBS domain-containing protein|nr:hypothetical protein [Thermotogaceae bacterium]MDN5337805.1 hypothetical protein [Thermotogaceae bacterium]